MTSRGQVERRDGGECTIHAALSGRKQEGVSLEGWHDVPRHIDPGAIKDLGEEGLDRSHGCNSCFGDEVCNVPGKSVVGAISRTRGGSSLEARGEAIHADDIAGPHQANVCGMKHSHIFMDEASRDKRNIAFETRDATVEATVD